MHDKDEDFEPLGIVERFLLDGWRLLETPEGCRWIDDQGRTCGAPIADLSPRHLYCEGHLQRALTESAWQRLLQRAGRPIPEGGAE